MRVRSQIMAMVHALCVLLALAAAANAVPATTGACVENGVCSITDMASCSGSFTEFAVCVTLNPTEWTTIAIDDAANPGNLASDTYLFFGVTAQPAIRRTLVRYDFSGLVASEYSAAFMSVDVDMIRDTPDLLLHRVTSSWTAVAAGTGDSSAFDPVAGAHWFRRNSVDMWTTPGGDFEGAQLGSELMVSAGVYTVALDYSRVAAWINGDFPNNGLIMIGQNEALANNEVARVNVPAPIILVSTPTGACCDLSQVCTDSDEATCDGAGGFFFGLGTTCAGIGVCPREPVPWADELVRMPDATPRYGTAGGNARYELRVQQVRHSFNAGVGETTVWGINGQFPGPTIVARENELVTVDYVNDLRDLGTNNYLTSHIFNVDTCVHGPNMYGDSPLLSLHTHGIHTDALSDGHPARTILPGQTYTYQYWNRQNPTTLWYHDHALGLTRLNNYAGIAGFYRILPQPPAVPDPDEPQLPDGEYYLPLILGDVSLDSTGEIVYPDELEFNVDHEFPTVNGKIWPHVTVKAGKYRMVWLNAAGHRPFRLAVEVDGSRARVPFHVIAGDQSYFEDALLLEELPVNPSERYEVIVDFAPYRGQVLYLVNADGTTPTINDMLRFTVSDRSGWTASATIENFPVPEPLDSTMAVRNRTWVLDRVTDATCAIGQKFLINYKDFDEIEDIVYLDDVENWDFANLHAAPHPMHVHLVKFQVVGRAPFDYDAMSGEITVTGELLPPEPWERNVWKDTVNCPPDLVTRVVAKFEDHVGPFVIHCHVLDHEDHEMMRQFIVAKRECDGDGLRCDPDEDAWGCPADCSFASSQRCGDGLCQAADGETCSNCPADCKSGPGLCCGSGGTCQPDCMTGTFACTTVAAPDVACGDGVCEGHETAQNCDVDCADNIPTEPGYRPNPNTRPTPCFNQHGQSASHHCV